MDLLVCYEGCLGSSDDNPCTEEASGVVIGTELIEMSVQDTPRARVNLTVEVQNVLLVEYLNTNN